MLVVSQTQPAFMLIIVMASDSKMSLLPAALNIGISDYFEVHLKSLLESENLDPES